MDTNSFETERKPVRLRNPPIPENIDQLLQAPISEIGLQRKGRGDGKQKKPPPEIDGGGNAGEGENSVLAYGVRQFVHFCRACDYIFKNICSMYIGNADVVKKLQAVLVRLDEYYVDHKLELDEIVATKDGNYYLSDILYLIRCKARSILLHKDMKKHNEDWIKSQKEFEQLLPECYKQNLLQFNATEKPPSTYSVSELIDSIDGLALRWHHLQDTPALRRYIEQLVNRAAVLRSGCFYYTAMDLPYYRTEVKNIDPIAATIMELVPPNLRKDSKRKLKIYNCNSDLAIFLQCRLDNFCYSLYATSAFPRLKTHLPPIVQHDSVGYAIPSSIQQPPIEDARENRSRQEKRKQKKKQRKRNNQARERAKKRRQRQFKRALVASSAPAAENLECDPPASTQTLGPTASFQYEREVGGLFESDSSSLSPTPSDSSETDCSMDQETNDDDYSDDDDNPYANYNEKDRNFLHNEAHYVKEGSFERYQNWLFSLADVGRGEQGDMALANTCLEYLAWPGEKTLWMRKNKGEECKKVEVTASSLGKFRIGPISFMLRPLLSPAPEDTRILDKPRGHDWGPLAIGTCWRDVMVLRSICGYFRAKFSQNWGDSFLVLTDDFPRCRDALGVVHPYPMLIQSGPGETYDCFYQKSYIHSRCAEIALFYWLYFIWRDFKGKIYGIMDLQFLLEEIFGSRNYEEEMHRRKILDSVQQQNQNQLVSMSITERSSSALPVIQASF